MPTIVTIGIDELCSDVAPADPPRRQPLAPGGADEVLGAGLEERRPGRAHHRGGEAEGERHRRPELLLQVLHRRLEESDVAGGRREVGEVRRQHGDDRRADDEVGDAEPEQAEALPDDVTDTVDTRPGEHADGDADESAEHRGQDGQLDRHRQRLDDQLAHRLPARHRDPEVAGEHAAQPREELPEQRLVEPVVALQGVALGVGQRAGLDPEAGGDLVAGEHAHHDEHEHGDAEQRDDRLGQTADQVPEHDAPRRRWRSVPAAR